MKRVNATKNCLKLACLFSLLCAASQAFCDFFSDQHYGSPYYEHYSNEYDRLGRNFSVLESQVIPIYLMMDNEKLFMAAEAEKDGSMDMMNRIMNNEWLAHRGQLNGSDMRVLKTFLRRNVVNYLRGEYKPRRDDTPKYQYIDKPAYREYSQFKDIGNYRVDVSDDEINFKFYYAFN